MGGQQGLDAVGRVVEAGGDGGDFVVAADRNAHGQIARAPLLDTVLQAFEAVRQPGDDRQCRHADAKRDHQQGQTAVPGRTADRKVEPGQHHAAVRQVEHPNVPGRRAVPLVLVMRGTAVQPLAGYGQQPAVRADQRDVAGYRMGDPDHGILDGARGIVLQRDGGLQQLQRKVA